MILNVVVMSKGRAKFTGYPGRVLEKRVGHIFGFEKKEEILFLASKNRGDLSFAFEYGSKGFFRFSKMGDEEFFETKNSRRHRFPINLRIKTLLAI